MTSPTRQRTRLPEYDYRTPGAYFITICTHDRHNTLGEVHGDAVELTALGEIAEQCWQAIPNHFPHTALDVHVIMPNHLHGIVWLKEQGVNADVMSLVGARHVVPLQGTGGGRSHESFGRPVAGSLPTIIRSFKAAVTRQLAKATEDAPPPRIWQRGFHEHVIRNEDALHRVREYIVTNPAHWVLDSFNDPAKPPPVRR